MSSEKATEAESKQFLKQVGELDKLADEDASPFNTFELEFLDSQADRVEEFGEKTYVSAKQAQVIDSIYRKIVLHEDVRPDGDNKSIKKRNRAASRADSAADE